MRQGVAFNFIPELLGDVKTVVNLSKNPKKLYLESSIETIKAAGKVFTLIGERKLTEKKKESFRNIEKQYEILCKKKLQHYEEEVAIKIEKRYQEVQYIINDRQDREMIVRDFIKDVEMELSKIIDAMRELQQYKGGEEADMMDEIYRKAVRNYRRLITTFTEGGNSHGEL